MAQQKNYNLNTKYGRRKARDQAAYNISQYTPEQKASYDSSKAGCILLIIIAIIIGFVIAASTGNSAAFLKWAK